LHRILQAKDAETFEAIQASVRPASGQIQEAVAGGGYNLSFQTHSAALSDRLKSGIVRLDE
jgi:hypothetical protein